jgi:hypothetical protein
MCQRIRASIVLTDTEVQCGPQEAEQGKQGDTQQGDHHNQDEGRGHGDASQRSYGERVAPGPSRAPWDRPRCERDGN